MPNIPLVSELGNKADEFQSLLNRTRPPVSVLETLLPEIAPEELFQQADSRVFVRARPVIPFDQANSSDATLIQKEVGYRDLILMAPKISLSGKCTIEPSRVPLDGVFVGEADDTRAVFLQACKPLLDLAVGGASTCVLCYGQTGSGKTFTTSGLVKYFAVELERYLSTHVVTATVVEVQSLVNVDLLSGEAVQVVEDTSGEIRLLGAQEYPISSSKQLQELMTQAASARATKSTGRNEQSSRSHMLIRLKVVPHDAKWSKPGHLFVADLAGSESTSDSATHDKSRQQEAKFINSSLMTLKDCIRARAMSGQGGKHLHIPFRQSQLTLMLRDCFELAVRRPTKTVVIACVSPLLRDARHSINTLRYASLLAVAPPSTVVNYSPDDPNGWGREEALSFLFKASRERLTHPEYVLPEGDGRALVHIPEAEFLRRVVESHPSITEKSAKMIYTELWKAVVDARTKTRYQPKKAVASKSLASPAAAPSSPAVSSMAPPPAVSARLNPNLAPTTTLAKVTATPTTQHTATSSTIFTTGRNTTPQTTTVRAVGHPPPPQSIPSSRPTMSLGMSASSHTQRTSPATSHLPHHHNKENRAAQLAKLEAGWVMD